MLKPVITVPIVKEYKKKSIYNNIYKKNSLPHGRLFFTVDFLPKKGREDHQRLY